MDWNEELKAFILSHRTDNPLVLALQQKKYPHINMKFVAQQVEGFHMAKDKLPSLSLCDDFVYPPKLNHCRYNRWPWNRLYFYVENSKERYIYRTK